MTLNDLERQNKGFYGFCGDFGLRHKSLSLTRYCHYVHFGMTVIKVLYSRKSNSNSDIFSWYDFVVLWTQ